MRRRATPQPPSLCLSVPVRLSLSLSLCLHGWMFGWAFRSLTQRGEDVSEVVVVVMMAVVAVVGDEITMYGARVSQYM